MRNDHAIFQVFGPPGSLGCRLTAFLAIAGACVFLAACGGGSGGGTGGGTATINGSVFASHVTGSNVTVKDAGGVVVAGPVATAADGAFSIVVPAGATSGALRLEAVGGSFADEATGMIAAAGRLAAYVEAGALGAGSAVHLTPASTIVHDLRVSGNTRQQADDVMTTAFGFTDNSAIAPKNDNTVAGLDNVARRLAALRAASFSRLTLDLGLPADNQFALVAAIASDLSDNVLNGRNGVDNVYISAGNPLPEDIRGKFAAAFVNFFNDTARNLTGLKPTQIGNIPFDNVFLTSSYRFEYIEGTREAVQGRTQFRIRITRRSDGAPVTGLSLTLSPKMYMDDRAHATPQDGPVVDNGDGTYTCILYYLMGTRSTTGMPMGFWELKAGAGGETAAFYPSVGYLPGTDTSRAILRGSLAADNVASALEPRRRYFLFNDGLVPSGVGEHTLNLFVAAYDNMMYWPPVFPGTTLRDDQGAAWTVNDVLVQASTDNVTWIDGSNSGVDAHWAVSGLLGLAGPTDNVLVRLRVNGEWKTTTGPDIPTGVDYAIFSVTP